MNSRLVSQLSLEEPGFWLLLSIVSLPLVYVIARRTDARYRPWIATARWVLIPYAGLMVGGLSPRFLGLSKINWQVTLSLGIVLLCGILLVAGAVRIVQSLDQHAHAADTAFDREHTAVPDRWSSLVLLLLWLGAEQLHWCFVRGALWELLLDGPFVDIGLPAYRAMWLAFLLVLPEIWLQPISLGHHMLKSCALAVTGVAFYYTRNFWLCWAIYASIWLLLAGTASSIARPLTETQQ